MKKVLYFKLLFTFFIFLLSVSGFGQTEVIFSENMGTGTSTQPNLPNYNFQNAGMLSGNFTILTSSPSSTYSGYSGGSNAFLNGNQSFLLIQGINTSNYSDIKLTFGQKKGSNSDATSTNFKVEYSTDGINWTVLSYINSGNTDWRLVSLDNGQIIPTTSNLRIKFSNLTTQQYRLDDIKLVGTLVPQTAPLLSPSQTVNGTYGVLLTNYTVENPGGSASRWTIDINTIPQGLSFTNGVFSGTPTSRTPISTTVTATNSIGSSTAIINFNIAKAEQTVNLMDSYNLVINENIQLPINSEEGLLLNYTLSNNTDVVEIIGNQLKALAEGQVTLIVSNDGNNIYKEFSKEIVVKVSLYNVNDLMISQIYTGGSGTGATYKNDFVELYNSSDVTIPLFGLHLQYASDNGNFKISTDDSYDLTLSFKENDYIEPKSFYLIKLGGGSTGSDFNYFENTANINIATVSGKLALTKRLLDDENGNDRTDIIDLVGYGNANIYEGLDSAPSPTVNKSIIRKLNGTQDTNDNKNDFVLIDVNPYINISVWENGNWFKGILPNVNRNAVLLSNLLSTTSFTAKNVLVYKNVVVPSGVVITSEESLRIKEGFTLTFNEGAYLLQNNPNAVNSGNATFKRNATFFRYDSKFWSSPVEEQSISGFMPNPSGIYTYNTANRNWDNTTDTNFLSAKGYIFQAGSDYPYYGNGEQILFDGSFTGVPHNGNYSVPVSYTGLGDNGVGNPYGSPISASAFLNENDHVTRLYFWDEESHYIPGTNPPRYRDQSWSALNQTGHNDGPTKFIGVGVGFIARVSLNENENDNVKEDVVFNNSMRTSVTNAGDIYNRTSTEKDRFWLSLNLNNNKENQILIGYVEGATNGIDEKYDARNISNNNSFILSHSNANAMIIEGRQYPLDVNDQIPLYFRASELGDYTIKLENKEGIFNSQPIYLIDNELNLSINLNEVTEYSFSSEIGNFIDRFEIRYQPKETLSTNDLDDTTDLIVYKNDKLNKVTSKENVNGYKVYDFSGKLITTEKVNQLKDFSLTNQNKGTYIVKFTLENGRVISKKVIF